MAIVNRTLDASEQKQSMELRTGAVVNAAEVIVGSAPRAQTITGAYATCFGISGAPTGLLRVTRFGGASYLIGTTFLIPAVGVSGIMGISLAAVGSSLLNLQARDLVTIVVGGGSGAAATSVALDLVVQNIQDIKSWF